MRGLRALVAGLLVVAGLVLLPTIAEATEAPLAPAWVNTVNTTARSATTGVALAPNGDILTVGWFEGQATFGSGASAVTVSSAGGLEGYLARTRPDGSLVWVRAAGGVNYDQMSGVRVAPGGSIYVWGSFSQAMSFRGSTPPLVLTGNDVANNGDGFVARYDANGVPQWARRVGGQASDGFSAGAVDASGRIVLHAAVQIGSATQPTIDTGIGAGTRTMTGSAFVRYDTAGVLGPVVSSDPNLSVRKMIARGDGTFAVGGTTSSTDPYDSAVLEIHDANLTYVSSRVLVGGGSGNVSLNDMAYDSQDNLTVVGLLYPGALIGGGTPLALTDYHGYVASFTPNGVVRWSDTPKSVVYNVATRPGDGVVIGAFFNPSAYPPPSFASTYGGPNGITLRTDGAAPNGTGIAIAEYESNGAIRSAQVIRNNDYAVPGPIIANGTNVYLTGMMRGPTTFGLGTGAISTPATTPNDFRGFLASFTGRTASQVADLRVDLAAAPPVTTIGSTATVTAHVRNTGPDTATSTKAAITLTSGLSLSGAVVDRGSVAGTTWTIGNLPRDQIATITMTVAGANAASSGGNVTLAASSDAIEISQGEESVTTFVGIDFDGKVSPDLGWVHRLSTTNIQQLRAAPIDGGAVTAALSFGRIDEGVGADARRTEPPSLPGGPVMAVARNDTTGTVLWSRGVDFDNPYINIPQSLGGVGSDSSGNVYVAGVLTATARFAHGDGTFTTLVPPSDLNGLRPAYLASWDANGTFRFADVAISKVAAADGVGIDVLPSGTVYLAASLFGSSSAVFGPAYSALTPPAPSMSIAGGIGAFDSTGHPLWAQLVRGGPGETTGFRAIDADAAGITFAGVLVNAAKTAATFQLTSFSPTATQGASVLLTPSKSFTALAGVARGPGETVGVVGTYSTTITIGGLPPLPDTAGLGSNGWAALVTAGTPTWSTALIGDKKEHLDAVSFDNAGHLVVGGGLDGTSSASIAGQTVANGGGAILAVLADEQSLVRSMHMPPSSFVTTGIRSIGLEANGDILFAGTHPGGVSFGKPPATQIRLGGGFAATLTSASAPPSAIAGVVTDQLGQPWANAIVTVMNDWPAWIVAGTVLTDATGHYRVDFLPPQSYRVRVADPDGRFDRTWYPSASTYATATPVLVRANVTTTVDLVAARTGGGVHGHVTDSANAPITGIWVQVFDDDGYVAGRLTDSVGNFEIPGLPQGTYAVRFVDPSNAHATRWWPSSPTRAGSNPVTVTFPAGALVDMTLP
jgi:hypothetical protein